MIMLNKVKVGDWILAENHDYGMLRGYIVEGGIDLQYNQVKILVCEADDKTCRYIGKNITVPSKHCMELNETEGLYYEEGFVLNMIDFSLITMDKPLFMKMTDMLRKMRFKVEETEVQKAC